MPDFFMLRQTHMLHTIFKDFPIMTLKDRRSQRRRLHVRAAVRWPVTVIAADVTLHGLAENISQGGAFLLLPEQLAVQGSIRLAIEIPDCQDVITAVASVVRSHMAPKDTPDHLLYAAGVEFTKISEDSLKFFSGNLAPEWEKDINERDPALPSHQNKAISVSSYLTMALLIALVASVAFSAMKTKSETAFTSQRLTQVDDKLKQIELQLQNLQTEVASFKNIQEEAKTAALKTTAAIEIHDAPPAAAHEQDVSSLQVIAPQKTGGTGESLGDPATSAPTAGTSGQEHPVHHRDPLYYVVKPGDNLFRIGLKNDLTGEQLRKMNNLSVDYAIRPGQKLRVR
jgi:LysM repeat protein/cell division protein FtsL